MKFKIGNKVKLVGTPFVHEGAVGTITEKACGYDWVVKFVDECTLALKEKELEPVKDVFKVGDRVRTKNTHIREGSEGRIIRKGSGYDWIVEFDVGDEIPYWEGELELVKDVFKVGDRIRIKDDANITYDAERMRGTTHTILEANADGQSKWYMVDGGSSGVREGEFELVKEDKMEVIEQPNKFMVGDRVKLLKGGDNYGEKVGKIGVICTKWDDGCYDWDVKLDVGYTWLVANEHLELVKSPCCEFKVGDLVRRTEGNIGKVTKVDADVDEVSVSFGCVGKDRWLGFDEVEKV